MFELLNLSFLCMQCVTIQTILGVHSFLCELFSPYDHVVVCLNMVSDV